MFRWLICVLLLIIVCRAAFSNKTEIGKQNKQAIPSFEKFHTRTKLKCGRPIQNLNSRIVGGKRTAVSEFPWIISLQRERSFWFGFKAFFHSCGASLISPTWVITAAHCLYNKDEPLRAVAGVDNLNYLYHAQIRSVIKTILHPYYDSNTFDNDIALIKVNSPFNLGSTFSNVNTICLESGLEVDPYDIATICGFGAKAFHQKSRTHLYKTDIAIIDHQTCNDSFSNSITDNMICAGGMILGRRDACSGDSGGPLQLEVDGHSSLIGLVSFGNNCASKGFPGIYTRVTNYYNWIVGTIDEHLPVP